MAVTPTNVREEGLGVAPGAAPASGAPIRQSNLWKDAWRRYIRNRGAVVAGAIFLLVLVYCVAWPVVSSYSGNEVDFAIAKEGPSLSHPFGTDKFGRDLFTRTAEGGPSNG